MKITKTQLVQIIKEEIESISEEKWEATGNRYSRAGVPGSKAGHNRASIPGHSGKPSDIERLGKKLAALANAMGEDMTFEDALTAVENSRKSRKGLDVPDLEENMGDYYDPRQPGGYHDQPTTTTMQLEKQCENGDQVACKMLKKRQLKKQCEEGDQAACEMLKKRLGKK